MQQGSHWGLLCPGVAWPVPMWYSSWSWRHCIQVNLPLGQAFLAGWDGCTAAGSSMNTMDAISEILAPCSRTWQRHAFCFLIYKNAPGWLAWQFANLEVGVSGCILQTDATWFSVVSWLMPSEEHGWLVVLHSNHSYTLLVHCWRGFIQTQKESESSPTNKITHRQTQTFMAFKVWKEY